MTCLEVLVKMEVDAVIKKKKNPRKRKWERAAAGNDICIHTNTFIILNVGR